jgi:hypothetical protein
MSRDIDGHLDSWTKRIVRGEASLTDVPDGEVGHIAREVKAYANHFPDIGRSTTVRRLTEELTAIEVSLNETN